MVGASVLIALAVIILPMLLGGRPEGESQQTRKIELPAQPPELSFETRRYPIGEPGLEQQAKKDESIRDEAVRPLPAPKAPASKVDQTDDVDSTVGKSGIDEQASAPVPLDSSSDPGRYIVQVASFGALENADKLSATLRSSGYSVMTDRGAEAWSMLHTRRGQQRSYRQFLRFRTFRQPLLDFRLLIRAKF